MPHVGSYLEADTPSRDAWPVPYLGLVVADIHKQTLMASAHTSHMYCHNFHRCINLKGMIKIIKNFRHHYTSND